jgi:hypothetical protein
MRPICVLGRVLSRPHDTVLVALALTAVGRGGTELTRSWWPFVECGFALVVSFSCKSEAFLHTLPVPGTASDQGPGYGERSVVPRSEFPLSM